MLWVNPRRAGELLGARRYRIEGRCSIEIADTDGSVERWVVEGGPDGAAVSSADGPPDLAMTRAAFGALLLGGVTATELRRGQRLEGDGEAVARADAFFG